MAQILTQEKMTKPNVDKSAIQQPYIGALFWFKQTASLADKMDRQAF